jgi:hypothetical protein
MGSSPPTPPAAPSESRPQVSPWVVPVIVALSLAMVGYIGFDIYHRYNFPKGYRNRPTSGWHRPGSQEFSAANDKIDSYQGTAAFGNTAEGVELAAAFSAAFKAERKRLFTADFPIEVLDSTDGEFLTWCELHPRETAFIVHVPGLRLFDESLLEKVDARRRLAQAAWRCAQSALASRCAAQPDMELAVGLRGISEYGPMQLGYCGARDGYEEGLVKYLDASDKTHFLWTFFAPAPPA